MNFEDMTTEKLLELKEIYDDNYYNREDDEELMVEDYEYDKLIKILKSRNIDDNIKVGHPIRNNREKIILPLFLGSLNKVFFRDEDLNDFNRWKEKYSNQTKKFIVSTKLDGMSCLYSKDSKNNIKLYTRGNGIKGRDITEFADVIQGIPKIDDNYKLFVRGELIIRNSLLSKLPPKRDGKNYKTGRGAVTGITNSKEFIKGTEHIEFIAYERIKVKNPQSKISSQISFLEKKGFNVVKHIEVCYDKLNFENLKKILLEFKQDIDYDIDGLVIQPDVEYYRNDDVKPKYAIAFKLDLDYKTTVVDFVEWNISHKNKIVPRIHIKKIELGGSEITHVSGHNAKYILDNGIGKGSVVNVILSGDIIPKIYAVIKESEEENLLPENMEYKWDDTNTNIYSTESSDQNKIKKIINFFRILDVKFVSEGIITKLYNEGYNTVFKILKMNKNDFMQIEGFKKTLTDKVYNSIHSNLTEVELYKLMTASAIFSVGLNLKKLKLFVDAFDNVIIDYQTYTKKEFFDVLLNTKGFSEKTVIKLYNDMKKFIKFMERLQNIIDINVIVKKENQIESELKGKIIVLSGFRDLIPIIENVGGIVRTSVSKNTDYVVVENINTTTTKATKARSLNIPIFSKEEFVKKFGL